MIISATVNDNQPIIHSVARNSICAMDFANARSKIETISIAQMKHASAAAQTHTLNSD